VNCCSKAWIDHSHKTRSSKLTLLYAENDKDNTLPKYSSHNMHIAEALSATIIA